MGKQSRGVLLLSIMATLIAVLGQNSFIGIFTVDFLQSLDLSFTQFGLTMMIATLLASFLIPGTGRLLDSHGMTKTTVCIVLGGVMTLLCFAFIPMLAQQSKTLGILLLGLSLTGFRLFFRGSFRMISTSLVTLSFHEKERGRAFMMVGVLSGIVGSCIPYLAFRLHEALDLLAMSAVMMTVLLGFAGLSLALRRIPMGVKQNPDSLHGREMDQPGIEPREAQRQLSYWLYMIGVPFYSLLLSSVILYFDPIATASGVAYSKGLAFYIPAAAIGIPVFAWASLHMHKSRLVFLLYLSSIIISFAGFQRFDSPMGQIWAFAGFGAASAFYTALSMGLWSTLYGRRFANQHLGRAAALDLFATAVGPAFFGLLLDAMPIIEALQLCLYLPLLVAILFLFTAQKPSRDSSQAEHVLVSLRARPWDRWAVRHHPELRRARLVPYWRKSLRYFPNHQFLGVLWQMLEEVEQGRKRSLVILETRHPGKRMETIDLHEWMKRGQDKFELLQALREKIGNIFYEAHGLEEVKGSLAIFHCIPREVYRREILNSAEVRKYIEAGDKVRMERQALKCFQEIVCDRQYLPARVLSWALSLLFDRLFVRMELAGVELIRELDRRYQLVYLPSHRSHIDFLSASQLLYLNGIEPPYIAASHHLNFFPVNLLRKVSSYFIRRKKMDPLYNAILYQYMRVLQRYGKSQMVFVEGTRSKIGETLQPKAGIVSQYINAYMEERARPVVFLPLNITYDFVLEGDSYLQHIMEYRENLNDLDAEHRQAFEKHLEERRQLTRWVRVKQALRLLWKNQARGRVYLTPGEPIFLDAVLSQHCPDWSSRPMLREDAIPDAWIREIGHRVARMACVEINRNAPLTPSSLVATALLASQGRALSEVELRAYVHTTSELWAKAYGLEMKVDGADLEAHLASIPFLNRCRRRGERRSALVSEAMRNLRKGERRQVQKVFLAPLDGLRSTYNRNIVIHSFVIPHLLANCLVDRNMVLREEMKEYFFMKYEPLRSRYHLPWESESAWRKLEHFLDLFEEKGLLSQGTEAIILNHREDVLALLGIYARALKTGA
jgi:1-acyl-sn-glycerol-3-phosphate acyltransferase/MFS family permease